MTPELAYFLKINVAIALFYVFYRLFFCKDTFFKWRRTALLCFFGISLLYPMLNIQEWIKVHEPIVAMADFYATVLLPEHTIEASPEVAIDWQKALTIFITVIYWSGVIVLTIQFLMQLGSILQLHFRCPKTILQGVRVHLLPKESSPFSFLHWIFVHSESHTALELSEIITHEATHVRQLHSLDVLFSECMCIICWFNPFVWLLKREVKSNLEYMADNQVLEKGYDSKTYQYHLLGLTYHKAAAKLTNSFNVLPLKNRIKMMNKRKSPEIKRAKYLVFLPLAALLMLVSNIEVVARTTKEFAKEVLNDTQTQPVITQTEVISQLDSPSTVATVATHPNQKSSTKVNFVLGSDSKQDSTVLISVEQMPEFPGGSPALMKYLSQNIKYPAEAQAARKEGRIIVSFVVKKDGSLDDIKIVRGVDPALDQEAKRVIAAMPKWTPGKQKGKAVNVKYTVPLMFRLPPEPETPPAEEIKASDLSQIVVVGYAPKEKEENVEPALKVAEVMPKFPGGEEGLMRYLAKNIKYPVIAQENKEQGEVVIRMIIGKDGNVSNIKIIRGVSSSLNAEAIRIINNMPKWEPGLQGGKPVAVEYTVPILFKLQ